MSLPNELSSIREFSHKYSISDWPLVIQTAVRAANQFQRSVSRQRRFTSCRCRHHLQPVIPIDWVRFALHFRYVIASVFSVFFRYLLSQQIMQYSAIYEDNIYVMWAIITGLNDKLNRGRVTIEPQRRFRPKFDNSFLGFFRPRSPISHSPSGPEIQLWLAFHPQRRKPSNWLRSIRNWSWKLN